MNLAAVSTYNGVWDTSLGCLHQILVAVARGGRGKPGVPEKNPDEAVPSCARSLSDLLVNKTPAGLKVSNERIGEDLTLDGYSINVVFCHPICVVLTRHCTLTGP
jgi:hypothetical protein